MIACLVTLPAFIVLVVLFCWTVTSNIFGDNQAEQNNGGNGEGGYRPWWDMDMRPEEMEGVKMILNLLFLVLACATLFAPIMKSGQGFYQRFNEGVLSASMFMFGNMLLVSFFYTVNFGRREGEEQNQNNQYYDNGYGYNPYWTMDEQQLLAYHEKIVSWVCLALGLAFFAVSACIKSGGELIPETLDESTVRRIEDHASVGMLYNRLRETWTLLSLCSIIVSVSLFVAACILFGGEDAQRMIEDGKLINLVIINLWMIIVNVVMMTWGSDVFHFKSSGSLGMGMLYGGTKLLMLMICILFANLSFDERQREEGMWAASATSVACLLLSLFHLVFAMRARDYQVTLIDENSERVTVLDGNTGMVNNTAGDFVRMDGTGMQMV
eukprot:CAMPEP_0181089714 /NCGR_PEP_ID=MMETSP1071-20121207/7450_1 /TAXON_ID=35127 /ORGANISM="Thalassiosira sp., Strain NH16" /LENGTH=381 /DNA_ID=CAMNT_0023171681 /DNA_START=87 /DNA_END=1232 /DNA_ORIENTATION=-